jgi:orotidine-5'-phosphate decarboxylase
LPYLRGENPKNLFVVVKSSNRSSQEVQDLLSGDRVIHTAMADLTLRWSTDLFGKCGYGEVGAVVGALAPRAIQELRKRYDTLFFLVPGYGAQGGVAKHAAYAFDRLGHGAVICASRSIIGAWQEQGTPDYVETAQTAVERMKRQLENYVTVL